ncbi:protein kinase [Oleiagrimonas sp. MCCC 1A03011]|uniref:helix-hairpin-helix domain-containing protein n=1 Tax=Oleiagrimonas sp. MCCC 1A03011 TaxID=1926883 RepID=UPI000DC5BC9C|nr:protein kinase [Oleiagrimonas sp. MCCC 1A03011]RAP58100.1 hypothetical protein BTJ49_03665 [Oleiagrimonas sp. MCCC 1A03011]
MSTPSIRIGGKSIPLGKSLGKGGEGDVFACAASSDVAIKVYKERLRNSREGKVRAMVESKLASQSSLVAFPAAVATDAKGRFAGFAMRLVSGYKPVHELYSPKSRKVHFPNTDYRFLIRVAQNIARAVATVHQTGCVIGDFNHSGVLISKDATVALIDADSFQFSLNGQTYPCVVGTEDFTPPELHGKRLAEVTRTRAHDNFGLAVVIFQLLVMGKHPYAGRYNGPDIGLGEAIAQNRFAYSILRQRETQTIPPPASLSLDQFPRPIAHAFEEAFGLTPSSRPSPSIWITLLEELEKSLRRCASVKTHFFPHASGRCIWCEFTQRTSVELFPDTSGAGSIPRSGPFDIKRVMAAIRSIHLPRPEDLMPKWSGKPGPPTSAMDEAKQSRNAQRGVGTVLVLAATVAMFVAPKLTLIWLAMGVFGFTRLLSGKIDPAPLIRAYTDADHRIHSAIESYLRSTGYTEAYGLRNQLQDHVAQYQQLDQQLNAALNHLQSTRRERQLDEFLDGIKIRETKIAGIGPSKTATLSSFGIETAADVVYRDVLSVPGFGPALTGNLVQWRKKHEARFRYNPTPNASDKQAENSVHVAVAKKRIELESKLNSGVAALNAAASRPATRKGAAAWPELTELLAKRARLEDEAKEHGIKLPARRPISAPVPQPAPASASAPSPFQQTRPPQPSSQHASTRQHTHTASSGGTPTCPICQSQMIRRKARRGPKAGKYFWGCSRYPACHGTRN